ncbi:MAG: MFS transporter [Thermoanaerobaculia bacterium]
MTPTQSAGARVAGLRRKITGLFLGGVGLANTGVIAVLTVSSLAAEEISGTATWSGFPGALCVLGTAAGTTLLAEAMRRWGRRNGLVGSYSLAALGAATTTAAVIIGSLPLLLVGMFTIGAGRSADALSRYLLADLYPVERRASAISWLVWTGTVGAVLGPNSLGPSSRAAEGLGLPGLSGPYLVAVTIYVLVVLLYFVFLRPDPQTLVHDEDSAEKDVEKARLSQLFRLGTVRIALAVLVVGQVVMVFIMAMTPVYLRQAGHGLGVIGLVMSSHIVGMFVLSPLTGRLVDRWGQLPVILAGQAILFVAAMSAYLAPPSEVGLVAAALFLLGLGWNLGFVAGSSLLSSGLSLEHRVRLQGVCDSVIWSSAALASASSGLVLAALGYDALCLIGAALLVIPLRVIFKHRRSLTTGS